MQENLLYVVLHRIRIAKGFFSVLCAEWAFRLDRSYQRVSTYKRLPRHRRHWSCKPQFHSLKKGLVNIHRYYIPLHRVEGWEGKVVWLKIPKESVKTNFERDTGPETPTTIITAAPLK